MRVLTTCNAGQKFGRLTVVRRDGSDKHRQSVWLCKCECGNTTRVVAGNLKTGNTKSCGCLDSTIHGHHSKGVKSPTYVSWQAMKKRCLNPKHNSYKNYGAKEVKICARWMKFTGFLKDMGERPSVDYCLSRRGDSGDYEPGNVVWSLSSDNSAEANRRRAL